MHRQVPFGSLLALRRGGSLSSLALLAASVLASGCLTRRAQRAIDSAELAVSGRLERAGYGRGAYAEDEPTPAPEAEDGEEAERFELLEAAQPPDLGPAADEAKLLGGIDLVTAEAMALEFHPSLHEAELRVRAMAAEARARTGYPAPTFMAELQAVPFERPYAVYDARMAMLSLRQEFPASGSLEAMGEAAAIGAQAEAAMVGGRARDLLREVGHAFADYAEASELHHAHVKHVEVFEQMAAASRARYAAQGALADVTRAELEGAMLAQHIAHEHGSMEAAGVRLNGLMGRHGSAPLGPAIVGPPMSVERSAAELVDRAEQNFPQAIAAELRARSAEKMADAADAEATVPRFTLGLSASLPVGGMQAGWGASFGMSLPWFWSGAPDRVESYRALAEAERAGGQAVRLRLHTEVDRALAAVRANANRLRVLLHTARPAALRAIDAAVAGYVGGGSNILMWLDALKSELDVTLDIAMVRAELDRALADLDWTVGERVPRVAIDLTPPQATEMQHP